MMGADFFESQDRKDQNKALGVPNVGIGDNTIIRGAIIDKNARIGKNVQLVNQQGLDTAEGDGFIIRDGVIVVPKNGVIPDGTII